jgi:hypothetical protein
MNEVSQGQPMLNNEWKNEQTEYEADAGNCRQMRLRDRRGTLWSIIALGGVDRGHMAIIEVFPVT